MLKCHDRKLNSAPDWSGSHFLFINNCFCVLLWFSAKLHQTGVLSCDRNNQKTKLMTATFSCWRRTSLFPASCRRLELEHFPWVCVSVTTAPSRPSSSVLHAKQSAAPPPPPPPQIVINAVYGHAMTTVKGTTEDLSPDYLLSQWTDTTRLPVTPRASDGRHHSAGTIRQRLIINNRFTLSVFVCFLLKKCICFIVLIMWPHV